MKAKYTMLQFNSCELSDMLHWSGVIS